MMLAGPGGVSLGELCKLNVNCTKKRGMLYVGIETITMRKRYQFTFAVKPAYWGNAAYMPRRQPDNRP